MAGVLAFQGYLRVLKDNGDVCADAKAAWYVAGTTTPTDTYTTSALSVANANPVEASALGIFPEMWLSPTVSYKVVITGTGVTTRTIDNVYGALTVNQLENDVRYVGVPGGAAYTTTGNSNAYVVSTGLTLTSLPAFSTLLIKASLTNTGPATLNVDGIGAKNIYKYGAALLPGELQSGQIYQVSYDGTQFQLLSASQSQAVSSNPNAIINGRFQVAQRGTSFTSSGSANNDDTYTLDRWYILSDGNDIIDVTQETSVVPTNQQTAIALDVETVNKKFGIAQIIEFKNCDGYIGETCTLSFKAKVSATTKLDNVKCAIVSWSGTADSVTSDIISAWGVEGTNPTLIANATYENTPANLGVTTSYAQYSATAAIDTASTKNIIVFIWSDVTDTTLGDFLYIADVKFERGSVATPSVPKIYSDELAECQRYFEKSFNYATAPVTNLGSLQGGLSSVQVVSASSLTYTHTERYKAVKRTGSPTITLFNWGAANAQMRNSGGVDCSGTSVQNSGDYGFSLTYTSGAGTVVGTFNAVHWTSENEL